LKLFRNLWFYVALFGLAPPIQKIQQPTKSVSTTLNSVGSMGTIALQAVGGPYMWNAQWSSAVQRIAQGTPPLVSWLQMVFKWWHLIYLIISFLSFSEIVPNAIHLLAISLFNFIRAATDCCSGMHTLHTQLISSIFFLSLTWL
jgi:hypothetical protein